MSWKDSPLKGKENVLATAVSKEGHAENLVRHEMNYYNWFPRKRCNSKYCFLLPFPWQNPPNLLNDPHIYIYIYIYTHTHSEVCQCLFPNDEKQLIYTTNIYFSTSFPSFSMDLISDFLMDPTD